MSMGPSMRINSCLEDMLGRDDIQLTKWGKSMQAGQAVKKRVVISGPKGW